MARHKDVHHIVSLSVTIFVTLVLLFAILVSASTAVAASNQVVINFDDLTGSLPLPANYAGLNWDPNWWYWTGSDPYNPSSPPMVIYAWTSNPWIDFSPLGTPVIFEGAYFAGDTGYDVYFEGYRNNTLVGTSGTLGLSSTPTFLDAGFDEPVDYVVVVPSNYYHFVMDDVTYTLYCDGFTSDITSDFGLADVMFGQTFTSHWPYLLSSVGMRIWANGISEWGDIELSIWSVDEDGLPDSQLGLTTWHVSYEDSYWYIISLDDPISLEACKKYAIVLDLVESSNPSVIRVGEFYGSNEYPEGDKVFSIDNGVTWSLYPEPDFDFPFILYGCYGNRESCMQPSPSPEPIPVPVGGNVYPVNRLGLVMPWIALGAIVFVGGLFLFRRRVRG
jgi:hypothetical protein